jgi:signal transduction histidine kinase
MKKLGFDAKVAILATGLILAIILVLADMMSAILYQIFNASTLPVNWVKFLAETVFILLTGLLTIFLGYQANLRRKRANELSRLEQERLANILNSMKDLVLIVNPRYDIEYTNEAMLSELGLVEECKCYKYLHDREEPCPWCKIESIREENIVYRDWYSLKNQRTYEYIGIPFRNVDKSLSNLIMLRDITERKQLEWDVDKLRELDKIKRNLLSTVSHELRTPLANIRGYASMLNDYQRKLNGSQKREFVLAILQDSERLANFVNELLSFSRLEAGLVKLEMRSCSIVQLLKRVVAAARIRSPTHQIVLRVATRLPRVDIDVTRIEELLDNLIDNAVKYSAEGTEIRISVEKADSELLLGVSDRGMGIPSEELEKIFSPMYRIEKEETEVSQGIGLGLSLCRHLVVLHGGRIWVESEVGVGSTFWFTLPLKTVSMEFTVSAQ